MSADSEFVKVLKIKGANGEERTMQFPVKLDLERPKRPRTTFSEEQLNNLEEAFRANGYLTGSSRSQLAARLGLSDTQVKVWFQNRRTKNRKKPQQEKTPEPVKPVDQKEQYQPFQPQPLHYPFMYPLQTPVVPPTFYPMTPHYIPY